MVEFWYGKTLSFTKNYDRNSQRILKIIEALKRGTFTLCQAARPVLLDAKQVVLDSHGAMLVGKTILERLRSFGELPDAIGGMSIGADPITGAAVTIAGTAGLPLKGFMVRKEPKGHGMQRYIEGPVEAGNRVVIVEDVTTTGGSSLLQSTELLNLVSR